MADVDYLLRAPLGWRDGAVLVWAGMRGAVTLAAAQTLPSDTPDRSLLVLIAFVVAASSLLIQGGTLSAFVRWIRPTEPEADPGRAEELTGLLMRVRDDVVADAPPEHDAPVEHGPLVAGHVSLSPAMSLRVLNAQRDALLDARDDGLYDAELLEGALERLDAAQISIELRST